MRVHITLDESLVQRLDDRVGVRQRSRFISEAVKQALENEERWDAIDAAIASVPNTGHDWDEDPSAWVRAQRRGDERRVG